MRSSFKQFARLMNRRSRSGQSIILVAFAFIALIAFVGIATDVALLFVRYSTLRRAVDAAAIAAAGQVRESASYLSLNAVAQQFIKVHGIDPSSVVVETCETEVVNYLKTAAAGTTAQQAIDARIAANPPSELCKKNPQKLVRVTAQVQSQTAFLQLIGWRTVTLEANAVSQTAVLDVALVLDTSLSEAADTLAREKGTWDAAINNPPINGNTPGNMIYPCPSGDVNCTSSADNSVALKNFMDFTNYSPYVDIGSGLAITTVDKPWGLGLDPVCQNASCVGDPANTTKGGIRTGNAVRIRSKQNGVMNTGQRECWYMPQPNNANDQRGTRANYSWAACCNDPSTQTDDASGGTTFGAGVFNTSPNWYLYDPDTNNASDPAESVIMIGGYNPFVPDPSHTPQFAYAAKVVSGDADGNYSDLVCRPFKDVRDAARKFIKKLDFVRGDRVFLVTFDSSARAIVPKGSTIPAITDKTTAIRTLNMQVGVEVNPYPFQVGCQSLPGQLVDPGNPNGWQISDYGEVSYKNVLNYWSISQCPDTNTGGGILAGTSVMVNPDWIRRDSVWVMVVLSDGYPNRTPAVGNGGIGLTQRDWLQTQVTGDTTSMPDYANPDANLVARYCWKYTTIPPNTATGDYQDGTGGVHGATPVSNPDYGLRPQWCSTALTHAQPNNAMSLEWGLGGGFRGEPINDKGSFGFCPWWTFCDLAPEFFAAGGIHPGYALYPRLSQCSENNPRGVWDTAAHTTWPATLNENNGSVPTCSDNDPDSRHFCMDGYGRINPSDPLDPNQPVSAANQPDPNSTSPGGTYYCDPHYDPDDYARDRADFAALINYMDRGADNKPKKGNFIAMYSIYFQHNNQSGQIAENILGVKFLRYVADAGDNGIIDNHLQRWYRDMRDGIGFAFDAANQKKGWQIPPIGLNEGIGTGNQVVTLPPNNVGAAPNGVPAFQTGQTAKTPPTGGQQTAPPTYNGSLGVWTAGPYNYPQLEDQCALYDFRETGNAPTGAGSPYENIARTDCGQFFYADTSAKINKAFTEIAGRLFTRLSR